MSIQPSNFERPRGMKATPAGMQLLDRSPLLQEVVRDFIRTGDLSKESMDRLAFVAHGSRSEVRGAGDVAIKLSTPYTGRGGWERPDGTTTPEDQVLQHEFLLALEQHLRGNSDGSVRVPKQYFALRSPKGTFLRAEELMIGWHDLDYHKRTLPTDEQKAELFDYVKERINTAMGRTALRLGLGDLGLGKDKKLHGNNVLVPKNSLDTPKEFCIIDQPNQRVVPSVALLVSRLAR